MEREKLNEILNKLNSKRQSHPNFCSLWSNYLNIKSNSFLKEINTLESILKDLDSQPDINLNNVNTILNFQR